MSLSLKILTIFLISINLMTIISCVEFKNCPTEAKYGKLNKIQVTNCKDSDERCPFETNRNVSMELTFETTQDFDTAKIRIAGILSAIPVPFKINPDQVCSYGAECPLKANKNNTIVLGFPIKSSYPKIQLTVQVSLTGPTGESILCIRFPSKIV